LPQVFHAQLFGRFYDPVEFVGVVLILELVLTLRGIESYFSPHSMWPEKVMISIFSFTSVPIDLITL
jgi:hypothetical protein